QSGAHAHARHDLARDRAGGDTHRGLARGGTAAATVIVQPVFDVVGVASVAGPVLVFDLGVILRALVDVLDQQRDWRTGGHLFAARLVGEHAREDFDLIRLLSLGR